MRVLLAADFSTSLPPLNVEVDTQDYDLSGFIVRYHDDALDPNPLETSANILSNSFSKPLLEWMPALQRVELPSNVDFAEAMTTFRDHPDVLYVEPDYQLRASVIPSDSRFGDMWNLENTGQTGGIVDADIDAARAWDVHTGTGATLVAVIDTGVDYLHADLASNIWINSDEIVGDGIDNDGNGYIDDIHGFDFANNDGNPMDDNGHGTHVAGTIGAVGNNGIGVTGINWNVEIMALKFLDAQGSGSTSDAIEAINYAVANGATLSNNSWGGDPYSQALYDAIESARNADHIFVAAAGNGNLFGIGQDNDATLFYPSSYNLDNIVAVAAIDHSDNLATFSNYGATTVDLAAPGVNILSTTPGGSYGLSTGTSMAAPHVAGVLTLVRDLHPGWTYSQVIDKVLDTVEPKPQLSGLTATGGRLNVAAALDNPEPPPPPPPSGSLPVVEDLSDNQATFFDVEVGNWSVTAGRYDVAPAVNNADLPTISTLRLDAPLSDDFEIRTTFNADQGRIEIFGIVLRDFLTNGMVVFDYQSTTDFKFAGPDMDQNRWVIGHRDSDGWGVDAFLNQTLSHATDYHFGARVQDEEVALLVDGNQVLQYDFNTALNDGKIGLGTRNASGHFDDIIARTYVEPVAAPLPYLEDLADGQAQSLAERDGFSQVVEGRIELTATQGRGAVSTLELSEPVPEDVQFGATINADRASGNRLSNGLLVFDYQDSQNFKFAGAYVGGDNWVIGHRTPGQWIADVLVSGSLDALVDYDLNLVLEGSRAELFADGVLRASHNFGEPLNDGQLGIAARNASASFDDLYAAPYTPPAQASLPHQEAFDESADFFEIQAGTWAVANGNYQGTADPDGASISTLLLNSVPANVEIAATINADPGSGGLLSNSLIIFDYQTPTDFRFAGAYVGGNNWVIGRRTSSGWIADTLTTDTIDPLTDVDLRVVIEDDSRITLFADGVPVAVRVYASSLTDGDIGLGTRDAISRFDDFAVRELTPATLPYQQTFAANGADAFFDVRAGAWDVANGVYHSSPNAGTDGISALRLESVPNELDIEVTVNADAGSAGRLSNALIIFDYQHASEFKFAGAYVGGNNWVIGHRTSSGWLPSVLVSGTINALTDYDLRLSLEGSTASLYADGVLKTTHTFADVLNDGSVGLGTRNAVSRFDNLLVREPGGNQSQSQDRSSTLGGSYKERHTLGILANALKLTPDSTSFEISLERVGLVPLIDAVIATWPEPTTPSGIIPSRTPAQATDVSQDDHFETLDELLADWHESSAS